MMVIHLLHRVLALRSARWCLVGLALVLGGCAALEKPVRPMVYDFGPGALAGAPPAGAPRAPLVLGEVEASAALDGTALLYRLAFANPQQLMPYSQARWSMPPAQLVRQRLQEHLSRQRLVLAPTDGAGPAGPGGPGALSLRVELEEFSHYFESPQSSVGLVRLRATVAAGAAQGERVLGQRLVVVRRPATSADAAGGARALAEAVAAASDELEQWIHQLK